MIVINNTKLVTGRSRNWSDWDGIGCKFGKLVCWFSVSLEEGGCKIWRSGVKKHAATGDLKEEAFNHL
jgi:hypothetical protein